MEWINVEDRLPPANTQIIVFAENTFEKVYCTEVFISENCIETGNKLVDYHCYPDALITHWMPLPQPPKESDKA